jgi:hypothetical protein
MKSLILCILFSISTLLYAQQSQEAQQVIANGLGAILAGDEVKAREDAISAALRNAVEQVVGTMIESDVLVENYQTVEDKIYTRTTGYVQQYDIISTNKQADNVLEVTVRATVKLSDLRSDLQAIGVLISRKGKPRTMVLIDERNITTNYHQLIADLNTTETTIMNELMNMGFPFVDAVQAKKEYCTRYGPGCIAGRCGSSS